MFYNVYRVAYLGAPRDHHAIFVESDPATEGGVLLHVVGDIQNGMTLEEKTSKKPEGSLSFVGKALLGCVAITDFDRLRGICGNNPPPAKQYNGPKRINPREPLRRCQEWTSETISSLYAEGILQTHPVASEAVPAAQTAAGEGCEEEYWTWSNDYGNWYHMNDDGSYEWAETGGSSNDQPQKKKKGKGSRHS